MCSPFIILERKYMVQLIFTAFFLAASAGLIFLATRFRKFALVKHLAGESRLYSWLLALIPVLGLTVYTVRYTVVGVIVILHLLVIWILADLAGWLFRKLIRKKSENNRENEWAQMTDDPFQTSTRSSYVGSSEKSGSMLQGLYTEGLIALLVTAVYLAAGWYYGHHVYETDYTVTIGKNLGADALRIVQISDAHLGCTFDGEGFARHMETVQRTNPDVVVITGDYVDDDSKREDLVRACRALGDLRTTYGVYFIFGNHDKGYFGTRDFSEQDLREELRKNGVRILEDQAVMLNRHICIIGRQDRWVSWRSSMAELMAAIDPAVYTIVLDHQPHDFEAQEEAGVDLVLCGHTHGGQMFPVGLLGEWSGANEKTYGMESRGNTTFIVNSGISDWAIPFKTAAIAEFGVIDILSVKRT